MFDPMAELSGSSGSDPLSPTQNFGTPSTGGFQSGGFQRGGSGDGGNRYGQELHSITIRSQNRTFYIDLKQSGAGKFFKMSEKSRGGVKTTIVFDVADLPQFIAAFQEMQTKI
jgi:hypothetical protein